MSNIPQRSEPIIQPPAAPPQAFLSYAWEGDSHANWVYNLATRLQESGIRIILDKWDLPLGSDQFYFMERHIDKSDFVIVICTPTYAQRADSREGGVGHETRVITSQFAKKIESHKFIPVLRSGIWDLSTPVYLKTIHGVDLSEEPYSQIQYEKLVRALHSEPIQPPPVGPKPAFSSTRTRIPAATSQPIGPFKPDIRDQQPNYLHWGDSDPGPCMDVIVMNSTEVMEAGRTVGLEYPEPLKIAYSGRCGHSIPFDVGT